MKGDLYIKIINFIKKGIKDKNISEGFFSDIDYLAPTYVSNKNPRYLEIDNYFYSGLAIVNYYREHTDLILKSLIQTNINMNISMFYEKQDAYKTIRDLTYHIGNVGVELKDKNNNRPDIDIAAFTYNDAKYIRKEIQVNNEDIYFLYIYIILYADSIEELDYNLNKIESICQSKGLEQILGMNIFLSHVYH